MTHTRSARTPTKNETHTLHNNDSVANATSEQSPKHATTYLFRNKYEQLHFNEQPLNNQLVAKQQPRKIWLELILRQATALESALRASTELIVNPSAVYDNGLSYNTICCRRALGYSHCRLHRISSYLTMGGQQHHHSSYEPGCPRWNVLLLPSCCCFHAGW